MSYQEGSNVGKMSFFSVIPKRRSVSRKCVLVDTDHLNLILILHFSKNVAFR